MSLIELCTKHFGCSSLYEVLGLEKEKCDDSAVKKAYYKQSLKVHPDRVHEDEKENATEKFQTLGKCYAILSDEEKRKIYDETGCVDDEDFVKDDVNWEDYWRLLFKKITKEDIVQFETNYKGSEEERNDVKSLYQQHEGEMDKIMSSVLCATIDDEPRIREIIQKMIDADEVPSYKAFISESKKKKDARKKKADREAQMAEKMAEEMGLKRSANGSDDGLIALIQKRNQDRAAAADNFFSSLEAKYGGKTTKKKSSAKKMEVNSDEDEEEEKPQRGKKAKAVKRKM